MWVRAGGGRASGRATKWGARGEKEAAWPARERPDEYGSSDHDPGERPWGPSTCGGVVRWRTAMVSAWTSKLRVACQMQSAATAAATVADTARARGWRLGGAAVFTTRNCRCSERLALFRSLRHKKKKKNLAPVGSFSRANLKLITKKSLERPFRKMLSCYHYLRMSYKRAHTSLPSEEAPGRFSGVPPKKSAPSWRVWS